MHLAVNDETFVENVLRLAPRCFHGIVHSINFKRAYLFADNY